MEEKFMEEANKLFQKELEHLRKKFKPYMRQPFLKREVVLKFLNEDVGEKTLGCYKNTKKSDGDHRYSHEIYLTELALDDYIYWISLDEEYFRRYARSNLKRIIRHELIHAFVFEDYEEWFDIKGTHSDYSPIFLSCLYWGDGYTGHSYTHKFFESDLYKKIDECKKYDEVRIMLSAYLCKFEETVRKINEIGVKDIHNPKALNIEFNSYEPGTKKIGYIKYYSKYKENGVFKKGTVQAMVLGIGFLVTPEILLRDYQRKFDNGAIACTHTESVLYACKDNKEFRKPVVVFEN